MEVNHFTHHRNLTAVSMTQICWWLHWESVSWQFWPETKMSKIMNKHQKGKFRAIFKLNNFCFAELPTYCVVEKLMRDFKYWSCASVLLALCHQAWTPDVKVCLLLQLTVIYYFISPMLVGILVWEDNRYRGKPITSAFRSPALWSLSVSAG